MVTACRNFSFPHRLSAGPPCGLHLHYGTLQAFIDAWTRQTAAANNGVPVPLHVAGIDALPPLRLRVVTSSGQVGIQGSTFVASKFFDIKRLGATGPMPDTFTWESEDKVYVCNQPWTQEHVRQLLVAAAARHMPNARVEVTLD